MLIFRRFVSFVLAAPGIDPLPSVHLHNTMQEFISKFPEGVFKQDTPLGRLVPFGDEEQEEDADEGNPEVGVVVEWVLGVRQGRLKSYWRSFCSPLTVLMWS